MTELLRIGEVATALGVSVDTVRRWEADGRVEFQRRGTQRVLPASELAGLVGHADDSERRTSARNRLDGIVIDVQRDGVMAQVELLCRGQRIVSLMTSQSVDALGLQVGVRAAAVIKATNVTVEI